MSNISRRERILIILVAIVVVAMIADRWVIGPLWDSYDADCAAAKQAEAELSEIRLLTERKSSLAKKWNSILAGGGDLSFSQAEQDLAGALQEWEKRSGLTMTRTDPQRSELVWDKRKDKRLGVVSYRVNAVGRYASITKFLELLERDPAPIRLDSFDIVVPNEGKDELRLTVIVSQICNPDSKTTKDRAAKAAKTTNSEIEATTKRKEKASKIAAGSAKSQQGRDYALLLKRNIFSSTRRVAHTPKSRVYVKPTPAPRDPRADWVFRGVLEGNKGFVAMLENVSSGQTKIVLCGEELLKERVKDITLDQITLCSSDGTPRTLEIGQTLIAKGSTALPQTKQTSVQTWNISSDHNANQPAEGNNPTSTGGSPESDTTTSGKESIIERMRRRRQRMNGGR